MAPEWADALGYVAGVVVNGASAPQIIKTVRTGSARDLSWGYLGMYLTGVVAGVIYAMAVGAEPVVLANAIGVVGGSTLCVAKAVTERRTRKSGRGGGEILGNVSSPRSRC